MSGDLRDRDDLRAYLPPTTADGTPPRQRRRRDLQDSMVAIRLTFYVGVPLFLLLESLVLQAWRADRIGTPAALALGFVAVPGIVALALYIWLRILDGMSSGLVNTISGATGQPALVGFSREESLVIRGQLDEAAAAYAARIAAEPTNIEARLRLAALQAGPLARPDDARATYLAARAAAAPSLAYETAISAALLELFRRQGDRTATKAELARHARLLPDTPSGRSALTRLRAMAREDAETPLGDDARPGDATRTAERPPTG